MNVYVDATPLYNLGQIGDLGLLAVLGGQLVIPRAVIEEITVEPATTNIERFLADHDVVTDPDADAWLDDASALLDEDATSDVAVVAGLLGDRERGVERALASDDRRLRAVAEGLGASVTGTFGLVVSASVGDKYFSTTQAKRVVRRTDHHGLQMTGRLRERAVGEVDP